MTTRGDTPWTSSSVAHECRRSWNRIGLKLARARSRLNDGASPGRVGWTHMGGRRSGQGRAPRQPGVAAIRRRSSPSTHRYTYAPTLSTGAPLSTSPVKPPVVRDRNHRSSSFLGTHTALPIRTTGSSPEAISSNVRVRPSFSSCTTSTRPSQRPCPLRQCRRRSRTMPRPKADSGRHVPDQVKRPLL